ncbi:hypothetical protein ACFL1J_06775, partial [Pseudomonadota bacterium]
GWYVPDTIMGYFCPQSAKLFILPILIVNETHFKRLNNNAKYASNACGHVACPIQRTCGRTGEK